MWAEKGVRPTVVVKHGYKNFYVYSSVSPITGEHISLFLPFVNTSMMNLYLDHMSDAIGDKQCFLIMDQAGWHKSGELKCHSNIEIVYLPPYSPELNPVERLWQWLKRHSLRNRFHLDLEAMMDAVQECLQTATPSFLQSLCHCGYLLHPE